MPTFDENDAPIAWETAEPEAAQTAVDEAQTPAPDAGPTNGDAPEGQAEEQGEAQGGDAPAAATATASETAAEAPADPDELELSDAELAQVKLPDDFGARIEAVLLTSGTPMTAGRIARQLDLRGVGRLVRQEIASLNAIYADTKRSFRIEEVAGCFQVMTLPIYAEVLGALRKTRITNKVSKGALEALAIVAYRQPIVRADVDAIRGVASGEVLKTLMDHHLVKQVGRAESLGRPVLYGTTKRFLEVFGLGDLKDLPKDGSLRPPSL